MRKQCRVHLSSNSKIKGRDPFTILKEWGKAVLLMGRKAPKTDRSNLTLVLFWLGCKAEKDGGRILSFRPMLCATVLLC